MPAERSRRPGLRAPAAVLAAAALIAAAAPAAGDDAPPSPLQARLDALQRIEVTEARTQRADAAPATPAVQQALDEAEAAEHEGTAEAAATSD